MRASDGHRRGLTVGCRNVVVEEPAVFGRLPVEASPGSLRERVSRVENQVGDVAGFVARPVRLGWGDPSGADGVVKFVVVRNTGSPAVTAEPGTRIGAGRCVVV